MAKSQKDGLEETRRLIAALGRMPPKPHDEMKLGRQRTTKEKKRAPRKKRKA
jgi:hypothetical protein